MIAGALALTCFAALALLTRGHEATVRERPASAEAFVDSIGVNTHFNYVDTAYGRREQTLERLRELGVRHVRDAAPVEAPALAAGLRGAAALGIHLTLGAGDIRLEPRTAIEAAVREVGGQIAAFEGPNELDNSGLPDWRTKLHMRLEELRAAADDLSPAVPLLGPSFVEPLNYKTIDTSTFGLANFHPYAGGLPPEKPLEDEIARARAADVRGPLVFTETGYHNAVAADTGQPPASENAAAVYLPRTLLKAFDEGVRRTFIYELLDEKPDPGHLDPEQNFGLLRQDLTPKPAFNAVRNLIAAVRRSPGPISDPSPWPSIQIDGDLERVQLQRRDGSRVVAIWRPVSVWDREARRETQPGLEPVDVVWSRPVRDLMVRRPTLSPEAIYERSAAARVRLMLAGDVVLLSYR